MPTVGEPLLAPTLTDHVPRDWHTRLPWRTSSQMYVGLLGGPVAVAAIGAINARRLRMPALTIPVMVLLGVTGTLAAVTAAVLIGGAAPRLLFQLAGALTAGPVIRLQRAPERIHTTFSPNDAPDADHASLWGPGIAAIAGGWVVEALALGAAEAVA